MTVSKGADPPQIGDLAYRSLIRRDIRLDGSKKITELIKNMAKCQGRDK